jgi:hypothetical protein
MSENIVGQRPCSWCTADITIVRRPGRPRLYCNQACRQRAYEHRHGFRHRRIVRSLPGQLGDDPRRMWRPTDATGYEAAGQAMLRGAIHALRTSVRPEGRRRETLCGLLAAPSGRPFSVHHPKSCATCGAVAQANPLRHPIDPSNELARLRAVIDEAVEQRLAAADALRWLHHDRQPEPAMAA